MGCDSYAFPEGAGDGVHPLKCEASDEEKRVAQTDYAWWKATLGDFYSGFFDEANYPRPNFRKIMHIHVTHSIIARYKEVKFVWAHVGLCMELTSLHPAVLTRTRTRILTLHGAHVAAPGSARHEARGVRVTHHATTCAPLPTSR